jgi:DNA invertase Pin-like site-specific DNA recombinase
MSTFDMNESEGSTKIDKYAIYLRKSRADEEAEKYGDEETLSRHKAILTEFAARKGYYIDKIYQEVVSGETIKDRPEIQKLINDCYVGKYKGILVVEITRLSRGNQGDAQTIMDCLKYSNMNNGILVVTPTKVYDVAHSTEDEEFMEFELFMSRKEYKMIKKRMDRGRKQMVVEGNYMGSRRPYGYTIKKTHRSRYLVPHPDEAKIVKQIFHWAANEKMTAGKIMRKLTAMGVPTYTGSSEWNIATIKDILRNPTYIGKVRWNHRMTVKTMRDGELIANRPRTNHTDHYMLYNGKHDALIDEETFKKAGGEFYSDKTKHRHKLINPFATLITCAKCGKVMGYKADYTKPNVAPRIQHAYSQICKVKSALYEDVQNAIIHGLKMYIEDFTMKLDNLSDTNEDSVHAQLEILRKENKKIETKLDDLFDAWEDKIISDNDFVKRKAKHKARQESILEEMIKLEDSIPEKDEYREKIITLTEALEVIKDETIDANAKNKYLKTVIDSIVFSRENNTEFILDITLR